MELKVYNLDAQPCGTVVVDIDVEYNEPLIHENIVAYLCNQRQGTKSALTRSEVRGHAKKPWAQKHTGRARQGSTKAPQWVGGGVAFAPKPRDFSKKMNSKAKKLAFTSALSQKLRQEEVTIIENIEIAEPKTKLMQEVLNKFNIEGKTILVTKNVDEKAIRASKNIPFMVVTTSDLLNTYDVVANKNIIMTVDAIKDIESARCVRNEEVE